MKIFMLFRQGSIVPLVTMNTVALVDDHKIFCDSLKSLINDFDGWQVLWATQSGAEAIERLNQEINVPNILLLDINMPGKNGLEVAEWISIHRKQVQVLVLTMEQDDSSILKMLQYGVRGYILKDSGTEELLSALQTVIKFGYYYTPIVNNALNKKAKDNNYTLLPELKDREKDLLKHMCTDMSYSEIAMKMFLSESTVDTYRARLFEKFEVKNRIGLLLKANRLGLIKL